MLVTLGLQKWCSICCFIRIIVFLWCFLSVKVPIGWDRSSMYINL